MSETIEEAFAAIPNQTCTQQSGLAVRGPAHVKDCERCVRIRAFGLVVASEASQPVSEIRKRIKALGR